VHLRQVPSFRPKIFALVTARARERRFFGLFHPTCPESVALHHPEAHEISGVAADEEKLVGFRRVFSY
jgi:hypothetical protein